MMGIRVVAVIVEVDLGTGQAVHVDVGPDLLYYVCAGNTLLEPVYTDEATAIAAAKEMAKGWGDTAPPPPLRPSGC